MRLDRFLCEMKIGSRSQVKGWIRQGSVTVNGLPAGGPEQKIDEHADEVCFRGKKLEYRKFIYYMMNKPEGVISASASDSDRTVVSLLGADGREDLFPVGRLDRDVTGLLILTNDGELAHRLLAPKKHVDKVYRVSIAHTLSGEDIRRLEEGLDIGEEKPTLPAKVEVVQNGDLTENVILLTLREGKFHQVKRMLRAVGNEVLSLERVAFGGIPLDGGLRRGEYRELTAEELETLRKCSDIT